MATSETRDNWFEVPEIKKAHEDLMAALKRPTEAEKEAYPAFRHACLTSPDLIYQDALALADEQFRRLKDMLPAQLQAGGEAMSSWKLEELDLYGARRASLPRA